MHRYKCRLLAVLLVCWCAVGVGAKGGRSRYDVFQENQRRVEQLNRLYREKNVTFALNQFAYMTAEEFRDKVLLPHSSHHPPFTPHPSHIVYPSHSQLQNLPDSFDWRDNGVVTSVKDQGTVGSCWAFSTVGNIEGQWALGGHNLVSLSAEQLVDCDATFDPNNLNQDCGVFGGWPYLAYQYVMKTGGIEPETDYLYCSGYGNCYPCVPPGYNTTRCGPAPEYCNKTQGCDTKLNPSDFVPGLKVTSWVAVEKNEVAMQAELVLRGPLSILIDASGLQFYHSGVWDPWTCSDTDLDHAILLVGYGTHKSLFSTKPYWLIKNSWGQRWGEDGYFRMIRGKAKCGISEQVTSAVLG